MSEHPEIVAFDDDHAFMDDLRAYFAVEGIDIVTISNPKHSSAIDFAAVKIVLLDLDMPEYSGRDVLAKIPAKDRPTVIIVSGHSDLETRIDLLDRGADFFMAKPIDLKELLLVCHRILGRHAQDNDSSDAWVLSHANQSLISPSGTVFGLTYSEYRILELLMHASPAIVPKSILAQSFTSREEEKTSALYRSLEVMISRMRTRFSEGDTPLPIKALRNVGYVFHGPTVVDEG